MSDNPPTIGIFGSHGYLGSRVKQLHPSSVPIARNESSKEQFVLDASYPSGYFDKGTTSTFLETIERRAKHARTMDATYVLLGSTSSYAPQTSRYAKIKSQTETICIENGGTVLRLGLVIDRQYPGGRYRELNQKIGKLPVVPIFHRDVLKIFCTDICDFDNAILRILDAPKSMDLLVSGTYETSFGEISSQAATDRDLRTHLLSKPISRAIVHVIKLCPSNSLDPIKSLSIAKSIQGKALFPSRSDLAPK
jgi:hypothetical protein